MRWAMTDARRTGETLAIALAGGMALGLPGLPAGWMSGAIIAVSVAALLKRPMHVPDLLARITFTVTGISLGGAVTPETLKHMASWPASLLLLSLSMVLLTVVVMLYLQWVHRWDASSALLASFPGGLATVMLLAIEYKADVRAVAVVQTVRVVAIAVLLPGTLALFGLHAPPLAARASAFGEPLQLLVLVGVSGAAAVLAQKMRFPGGLMFGAMITSAALHGAGVVTVTLPPTVAIIAFMILGGLTGTRFANMDPRTLRRLAGAAFGALALGVAVAFLSAVAAAWALSLATGPMVIAYAPGAIEAMMVLALALNYDPAFVGAHHLARFMLVLVSMPAIVRFMQRARSPQPDDPAGKE
ncbi:MAG: AbrB family transcriptional regulator [Variibacter sp.]|nr:AbrB family transcriptional regulator [Variibacter sp.]